MDVPGKLPRRLARALAGLAAALLLALGLPAAARAADDYDTILSDLDALQTLAESYAREQGGGQDPILLTLAYTRAGVYNDAVWQLVAGPKDTEFEAYVREHNEALSALNGMGGVTAPNGEVIDMGHLLASLNLAYAGVPIPGSWGGDCMELAQAYAGQASDAEGYAALMAETFNIEGDGSVFGSGDLRADLDAVNIGATLTQGSRLADAIRSYYQSVTAYDRAYNFIACTFGTVNTGDAAAFRQTVYATLAGDAGMQLLLYTQGMWTAEGGWQVDPASEPALRGAAYLLADWLGGAVNGERVRASEQMHGLATMVRSALAEALTVLGDSEAASAALAGGQQAAGGASSAVSGALDGATNTLRAGFDAQIFQLVLVIIGALALLGLVLSLIGLAREMRR